MPVIKGFSVQKQIFWGGDIFLIAVSFYLARGLCLGEWSNFLSVFGTVEITVFVLYILTFYIFDLHDTGDKTGRITYFLRLGLAIAIVNIPLMSVFYLLNVRPYGAGLFFFSACFVFLLTFGWRIAFHRAFMLQHPIRVVIMGAGVAGQFIHAILAGSPDYRIVGFLDDDVKKKDLNIDGTSVIGDAKLLGSLSRSRAIDLVILTVSHFIKPETYRNLSEIKMSGIEVFDLPGFCETVLGKIPVYHVSDSWFISEPILGVRKTIYNQKGKIIFDKLLSLLGLVLTAPLFLIIAIAIKMDSKGPVIYRQQRVGKDGQAFNLYKFRSMREDAEANGAVWARPDDPRVTRVGYLIRRLRVDEIPQFWNVLKGDMSLVGPRPERPEFVKDLLRDIPYFSLRHVVAPGITGWAQVNYPYGASRQDAIEKLQYDIYYIKNLSPMLDLIILARTVRIVLFGRGAR